MIYAINLAPFVPVCLHCGEIGPDGALFCTKCGFTLPQAGVGPTPLPPAASVPAGAMPQGGAPATFRPAAPPYRTAALPVAYAAPVAAVPGAVGPIAPPPSAKYCVKCRTPISQAAVYCPVCQQPQA